MDTLFDKFGGVRPMAEHLEEPPSTVQSWKTTGRVPAIKQQRVLEKAAELRIPVTAEDVVFPLGRAAAYHDQSGARFDGAPSSGNADNISSEVAA